MNNSISPWTAYIAIVATIGIIVPIILYFLNKPRIKVKIRRGGKSKNNLSDCLYMTITNKLHRPIRFVNIGCDAAPIGFSLGPDLSYDSSKTAKLDIPQKSFHNFWLDMNEGDKYTFCIKIEHIIQRIREWDSIYIECFWVMDENRNLYKVRIPKSIREIFNI